MVRNCLVGKGMVSKKEKTAGAQRLDYRKYMCNDACSMESVSSFCLQMQFNQAAAFRTAGVPEEG